MFDTPESAPQPKKKIFFKYNLLEVWIINKCFLSLAFDNCTVFKHIDNC